MKFLVVLALVGLAAADVSHLTSSYLPPRVSSSGINHNHNHNHGSDIVISRPLVNTYTTQQQLLPELSYSRQVNVAPSVQVIGGGYDSGLIGNGLIGTGLSGNGGYYGGNSGLIGTGLSGSGGYYGGNSGLIGAYDNGLSGGLFDTGYQSSGGLINGGLVGSGLGLSGISGLSGLSGLSGGSNVVRTISAPAVSNVLRTVSAPAITNSYESSVDTTYGSNGGYVYEKRH